MQYHSEAHNAEDMAPNADVGLGCRSNFDGGVPKLRRIRRCPFLPGGHRERIVPRSGILSFNVVVSLSRVLSSLSCYHVILGECKPVSF